MSTQYFHLRESYRNIPMGGAVTIKTKEDTASLKYFTVVRWDDDPEEPALFESKDSEEALRQHEKLCSVFRKYRLMWKCEEKIINVTDREVSTFDIPHLVLITSD